jgi:hypothetical protein
MISTITDTGVEALRARCSAILSAPVGAHIERLARDAARLEVFSASSCVRCWLMPWSARRITRAGYAALTWIGSSSSSCPSCR